MKHLPDTYALTQSSVTHGDVRVTRIISIYDGDTFAADIAAWPPIVGRSVLVRVYGIDAPELKAKSSKVRENAKRAREMLQNLLLKADSVWLMDVRRDKYFRLLANVRTVTEGKPTDVAEVLLQSGLVKPYFGGTKARQLRARGSRRAP